MAPEVQVFGWLIVVAVENEIWACGLDPKEWIFDTYWPRFILPMRTRREKRRAR